jgi:hypothetical protein
MPLREGGSLPALVEADDDGLYVLKFRGAGQGPKVLVAELVAGEIGRALGLPVPELVVMDLDPVLGRAEPDQEIKDLIEASAGLNLGMDFLPGSFAVDPVTARSLDRDWCARVVWFDAFITNVDRTARNTNMLLWHNEPWLIDHGAALYFHHDWDSARPASPFARIKDHVLLAHASNIGAQTAGARALLDRMSFEGIVDAVPDEWLVNDGEPAEVRARYVGYLVDRLGAAEIFAEEAERARQGIV